MSIENKIDEIFFELGMPVHQLGYLYAKAAIRNCIEGNSSYYHMMELYKSVADSIGSTPTKVERCIRHSVESAWNNSIPDSIVYKYFGNCISVDTGKPSNSQFVANIVNFIEKETRY